MFVGLCIPSSFSSIHKHLGSEETDFWTFWGGMLSYIGLIYHCSCSTVLGLLSCIFHFVICLDCRQASTQTLLLWCHAVVRAMQFSSERVSEPMHWFPWQSQACFQCSTARGPKHHMHPMLIFSLVLAHRDFSRFSESFDDIMYCMR